MGVIFSCFIRPKPIATHPTESTPISHPYPLASRRRAMTEYRSSSPRNRSQPISKQSSADDDLTTPTTPTSLRQRSVHVSQHAFRARSASTASTSRHPDQPTRVHEIPFPLATHPASYMSSGPSAANSVTGSPVRSAQILSPDTATDTTAGIMSSIGIREMRRDGSLGRRRLRKVRRVEKDWELWRMEDWVGYSDGGGGVDGVDRSDLVAGNIIG